MSGGNTQRRNQKIYFQIEIQTAVHRLHPSEFD